MLEYEINEKNIYILNESNANEPIATHDTFLVSLTDAEGSCEKQEEIFILQEKISQFMEQLKEQSERYE